MREKLLWKNLTKIAVFRDRDFGVRDQVTAYMARYIRDSFEDLKDVVIVTGASIADDAIENWCYETGIINLQVNPKWLELERPAAFYRNSQMIDLSDEAFFFTEKNSSWILNALKKAKRKGIVQKVLSREKLRKSLGIRPPVRIKLPPAPITDDIHRFPTSVKTVKKERYTKKFIGRDKLSDLINEAGLTNFFTGEKQGKRKKKDVYV